MTVLVQALPNGLEHPNPILPTEDRLQPTKGHRGCKAVPEVGEIGMLVQQIGSIGGMNPSRGLVRGGNQRQEGHRSSCLEGVHRELKGGIKPTMEINKIH